MENTFCLIISKYRLYQGITLYRSLEVNCPVFKLFILCMDNESYDICAALNMTKAVLIKLSDIEDASILSVKHTRKINEYCWTIKPFLLQYVIHNFNSIYQLVYIDADICFFNDPNIIFKNQPESSILLSEHDYFINNINVEEGCGKYNSGFIIFKRNEISWNILEWWKQRCLEWCFDRSEEGKFGDQKYLDYIPFLFKKVESIKTPGVNIAPWNDIKYYFHLKDKKFYVNNNPLICYHFCGVRVLSKNEYVLALGDQFTNYFVIIPYMKVIQQVITDVEKINPYFNGFSVYEPPLTGLRIHKISG